MIDGALQRELREMYNPEGSVQRKTQLRQLDILIELDRVCRMNDIAYWLDSGTLLGAVRHGGFIPWDDDLDVCILLSDYDRFCECMRRDLHAPYQLYNVDNQPCYYLRWPRVVDGSIMVRRVVNDGKLERRDPLWVDAFLMTPGHPTVVRVIDQVYGRCYRRKREIINDSRLKVIIGKVLFPLMSVVVAVARLLGRLLHPGTYVHDYASGFYSMRKKKNIFPLSEIEFEGHRFLAPCNVDAYLRMLYGDYMKIPPKEKRMTHNISEVIESISN